MDSVPSRTLSAVALLAALLGAAETRAAGQWAAVFTPTAAAGDLALAERVGVAVREGLVGLRRYPVLPRADTEALPGLAEMLAEPGCWQRPVCPAEVGGVVGARLIVGGQLARTEAGLTLTLHAFNVERGTLVGTQKLSAASADALLAKVPAAVDPLVPAPAAASAPASTPARTPGAAAAPAPTTAPDPTAAPAKTTAPDPTTPGGAPPSPAPAAAPPAPATAAPPATTAPGPAAPAEPEAEPSLRIVTWIAAAAAAAMLGVGAYYGVENQRIVDDAETVDPDSMTEEEYEKEYYDPSWEAAERANLFFGLGGALAGAAIILFFVEPYFYGSSDESQAGVSVLPGPTGVQVLGRF